MQAHQLFGRSWQHMLNVEVAMNNVVQRAEKFLMKVY